MGSINIDMDGVLAVYTKEDYLTEPPKHKIANQHYFASRIPDNSMCRVARWLLDMKTNTPVHVVSTLSTKGHLFTEQLNDKLDWLHRRFDRDAEDILVPVPYESRSSHKAKCISARLKRPLNITDVLVDDYNVNLNEWQACGGTAVKYLNGVNSEDSWKGLTITKSMNVLEITLMLSALSADDQRMYRIRNNTAYNRKEE